MKFLQYLLVLFLASCAMKSETIYSQGRIVGWNQSGFVNTNGSLQISFETNTANTLVDEKTFAGFVVEDKTAQSNLLTNRQTFQVKLNAKAFEDEQNVGTSASLSLDGVDYEPFQVFLGADSLNFGRHSKKLDQQDIGQFYKVPVRNDKYAHDWIIFEFDTLPPSPHKSYSMNIFVKDGESAQILEVHFRPERVKSYHSN